MFITIKKIIILHLFLGVSAATVGGTGTPWHTRGYAPGIYRDDKKKEKCEGKVTASHKPTNRSDVSVFKHAPLPYHHYPVAELRALKVDPDLDCSPQKRPTAPQAEEEEEEVDPEAIPDTPNEEVGERREC